MNAETSRTFRRDQKWRGSWKFQDRNRPKDSRPRFAPRPCRRMTVPKKITEPLKFTTMNDSVKEKAEKVKRKIDAGIDRTAEKISDVSDSVQQHATHVKHAVKEKVARAADSVKEKAQHISDSMRETK